MSKNIYQFQDEYRWLSNFSKCSITINDITYPSIEHAYQSAKSPLNSWKSFCSTTPSPTIIKKHSRNIKLIKNWEDIKVNIMRECLVQKYSQEPYKSLLLKTGNAYIQEGNSWGDVFWGVDIHTKKGQNTLGKLIMEIRNELQLMGKNMSADFLIFDFATLNTTSESAIISFSAITGKFDNIEDRTTYKILDLYFDLSSQIQKYKRTKNTSTVEYWKNLPTNVTSHIAHQAKIDLSELPVKFTEFYNKYCNSRTKIFVRDKSFDPAILQSVYGTFNESVPYRYNYYIKDITTLIDVCIPEEKLKNTGTYLQLKYNDIPSTSLSNCYVDILKSYYALTKTEDEILQIIQ